MKRIEIGDIIKTSYDTGPYEVIGIWRDCTCPEYLISLEMADPPASPPHIHLALRGMVDHHKGKKYGLNGYDERTLKSVWCDDSIILLNSVRPVQMTMF